MKFIIVLLITINYSYAINNSEVATDIDKTVTLIRNNDTEFGVCFAKVYRKHLKDGVVHLCKPVGKRCPSYADCVNPEKNIDMRLVYENGCSIVEKNCNGGKLSQSGSSCVYSSAICEVGTFANERDGYLFAKVKRKVSCESRNGKCPDSNRCARGL